jgi:hypothetical protein
VTADGAGVVSHAGTRLLADLTDATSLTGELSGALDGIRARGRGDPGRLLADLAVAIAEGAEAIREVASLKWVGQAVDRLVAASAPRWIGRPSRCCRRPGCVGGGLGQNALLGQQNALLGPLVSRHAVAEPAAGRVGRCAPGRRYRPSLAGEVMPRFLRLDILVSLGSGPLAVVGGLVEILRLLAGLLLVLVVVLLVLVGRGTRGAPRQSPPRPRIADGPIRLFRIRSAGEGMSDRGAGVVSLH